MWAREPPIEAPRRRRLDAAIVSTAAAALAFLLLLTMTTQVPQLRTAASFSRPPYDDVSSLSVVVLAVVLITTGIRVLRRWHRPVASGWEVTVAIDARIRLGLGLALLLLTISLAADFVALWKQLETAGQTVSAAGSGPRVFAGLPLTPAALAGAILVALTAVATVLAWLTLARAWPRRIRARRGASGGRHPFRAPHETDTEPDTLDDLLVLGGLHRRPMAALASTLERAWWSPRRHRILTGLIVVILAEIGGTAWKTSRDAAWTSSPAAPLFAGLVAAAVVIAYTLAVWPMHALRRGR